ncbi:40S ribosomal protein S4 [Capsicum chinense]|nr:40S ribosomal protein S4 [Capsicum chinense]
MARGLKKHLKRLNAPKHWMLDKLGVAFSPKPSFGPHKSREYFSLIIILRNRLKYTLTYREVISILMQRQELVDGKVRTDKTYPTGFMDVVSILKINESFCLLYDTKGRFYLHSLEDEEAKFKICKVRSVQFGLKEIPYLNTYDRRTIRYPDPLIKANDTIKLDLESNEIVDFIKFDVGNVVMVTGGRNKGRVGIIKNREKHRGSFKTVHIQDALGHEFATRLGNVFTLCKGTKSWVSLPKSKDVNHISSDIDELSPSFLLSLTVKPADPPGKMKILGYKLFVSMTPKVSPQTSDKFLRARLLALSEDSAIDIPGFTVEMFLALAASGTFPAILLGNFPCAWHLASSENSGIGISNFTVEIFLAVGASGTSPSTLLGNSRPFGLVSRCSQRSWNSTIFLA